MGGRGGALTVVLSRAVAVAPWPPLITATVSSHTVDLKTFIP